jgi:hypothetical protein
MGCINCDLCKHKDTDICLDCSTNQSECRCHLNPPCSSCVNSLFEDVEE